MTASLQIPVLAIVGRPNVGKSALFNRIAGRRIAIVHEESGVTRDRISATAKCDNKVFEVVDTGGIASLDDEKTSDAIAGATRHQAEMAIEMANALILVVDVTSGIVPLDREIAQELRASGKPVFLAVNKVDNQMHEKNAAEFTELGFEKLFPIAAIHGLGVADLLEEATKSFSPAPAVETSGPTRIAIVGRPNVGKSSLLNSILQGERTIVSEIPGTTRDSIDVPFRYADKPYLLIDTAGLRHRRKIKTPVDQFGLMRAERSVRECDVAVLVLDAVDGVTKQDKHIAGQIFEAGRGCVILVNKWDLAAEQEKSQNSVPGKHKKRQKKTFREEYLDALRRGLFFLDWAPVLFVSAKTGQDVHRLFGEIESISKEMEKRLDTPALNRVLARALDSYPPPYIGGKRFKIFYAYQESSRPPTVTLFVNDARCLTPHYERFLIDKIRAAWGFRGCPVRFKLRQRERRKFVKRKRVR
ncbi:MAG TPA: ribosome biogenesis GTPase Der [Verrucomicrobiae bacterium]|nr:ribosome biogenesis GTPase Der [Verrucomicrobiae bacterium]